MREKILELARGIAGESELLEALCGAEESRWRARLRQGVSPEDCGEAFVCAAAFTAAASLTAGRGGDGVASFTAGEVSVKGRSTAENAGAARAMRQAAEELMAPYTEAADFAFRGVRG